MDASEIAGPDPGGSPVLGESRAQVLDVLRASEVALSVGAVAEQVGLHPNTARFHLDALVEAGLAERATEERERPGRPRVIYAARPGEAGGGQRSYRLLAEILSSYLAAATPEPVAGSLKAGQAWGRYLADRPPPFRRLDSAAALRQLVRMLDDVGFAPKAVTDGPELQILLRHCPFREIAEAHGDVVCSIHLGLMQGLLSELDAPVTADHLDRFVEPGLCVAHLSPADDPGA